MKNYTFIKPFKTTIGSKDPDALLIGAVPFQEINFKIGDKINGSVFGGEDTNRVVETRIGNAFINIPLESLKEEALNQSVVNAPSKDVPPQTFLQKNKTNLLILGALVLGYLAYKKFNK
jgi:hypothetical protein